jgi:hypothetical protein
MSEVGRNLLPFLACDGKRADGLAQAICKLVKNGSELGALEEREIFDADGVLLRTIKLIPKIWLERLHRAVEVGAFERLSVNEIVDRILAPPLPDANT